MKREFLRLPVGAALLAGLFSIQSFGEATTPNPTASSPAPTSPNPTVPNPTVPNPTATHAPSTSLTLMIATGPAGPYLTDGQGRSLYIFDGDTQGKSTCVDVCAQTFPPVTIQKDQTVTGSGGVQNNLIGTITRNDGTIQVTYNGMPLYYYGGDLKPHDVTAQGIKQFGGLWNLIKPDGSKLGSSSG